MEKAFITVVILYALFVGIYLLYIRAGKRRRKDIVGKGSSIQEKGQLKANIVGKSRFDLNSSKPLNAKSEPLAATSPKSENLPEIPNTFAPSNAEKPLVAVPQEELDEAFSDTSPDKDNEPMDIDYPLEYEMEDEDEETEEVEGTAQAALASGVEFEDLGNAVRTVNKANEATPEQKQKAGNTLLEMRKTDMFEQVVSSKPDAKRIVTDLMAESLADFHRRKDKEAGAVGTEKKPPADFNIRDFA